MHKITSVIPTYNNLPFLKLTVTSVRQNCYYNDMPIFIFAENCTDGTNEWLAQNADELSILMVTILIIGLMNLQKIMIFELEKPVVLDTSVE